VLALRDRLLIPVNRTAYHLYSRQQVEMFVQSLELARDAMAQKKFMPNKRVPSAESQQDLSQASSAGLADSQGTDDINAMVQQALKEVI
jgi:hypothetical protein